MKKQVLFLFFFLAVAGFASTANAQSRTDIPDFIAAAKATDSGMAMLLPAIQKVREAAAAVPVIETARKLAARVQRAGTSMSQTQYDGFQSELAKIETDLNKILGNSTVPASQSQTPAQCQGECHDRFGDGFGGGKGWNRFWCKLGCFKVKVGKVEVGGSN